MDRGTVINTSSVANKLFGRVDIDDLDAARRYIAAYVSFFKDAEGEGHDHHEPAGHGSTEHHSHAH